MRVDLIQLISSRSITFLQFI